MSCCNKEKKDPPKMNCPLCKAEGEYIHYLAIEKVVKEELIYFVEAQNYYTCFNQDCEVVFFSEDKEQFWLIQDINLASDFDSITKLKKSNCGGCGGGCGSSCHK